MITSDSTLGREQGQLYINKTGGNGVGHRVGEAVLRAPASPRTAKMRENVAASTLIIGVLVRREQARAWTRPVDMAVVYDSPMKGG